MRKALNENPIVQVVMLGMLGIVVALLFMTRVMGGQDETGATAADEAATPAPTTADVAPAATPDTPSPPAAPDSTGLAPGTAAPVATTFTAGAGLPNSVVSAYENGDVVALLVVNRKGTEDDRLESEVQALRGGDTSVFVVQAKDVARYSRIAEGVSLDRVPALVVIEPKSRTDGELPVATISYGFRGPDSVRQTIRDAVYDGKELPYHPG